MTDLVMRKRAGAAGEVGLFIDSPVFEDDFAHIKAGAEVQVKATTPRSLRQLKFAWALATKIAEGCDWVESKEDCMDFMLIEARHFRRIFDPLRNVAVLKPRPTNFGAMDGTEYTRLLKRLTHVAVTIMIPGMDDTALKAEIEAMIGPDIQPDPPDAKPRATRAKKSDAKPPPADASDPQKGGQDAAGVDRVQENEGPPPSRLGAAPQNEEEYIAGCRAWLRKQSERFPTFDYFNSESHRKMRIDLKVSTTSRKMLEREIGEHFDAIDKKAKNAAQ